MTFVLLRGHGATDNMLYVRTVQKKTCKKFRKTFLVLWIGLLILGLLLRL